jgi:N-acetyl-beta-hexosaminidase
VDRFVKFINEELGPRKVNTMILMVQYNYQYESYPALRGNSALSKADVKKIVEACKKNNIKIIPQINLLGHQGNTNPNRLLTVYPQFEEARVGDQYKSYCPLHPDLHKVIFALIDEITDVFETNAFHAGMDEVFYIGEDKCPRCKGKDRSALFAGEVKTVRDHLKASGKEMWIWGDRLIDGKATGLGYWESSHNDTYRAVDMIPKDVVICDWHYNRTAQTDQYFAKKGLKVVTCPWKNPQVTVAQLDDIIKARNQNPVMKNNLQGMIHTVWSGGTDRFLDGFYGVAVDTVAGQYTEWNTFRTMFDKIGKL